MADITPEPPADFTGMRSGGAFPLRHGRGDGAKHPGAPAGAPAPPRARGGPAAAL